MGNRANTGNRTGLKIEEQIFYLNNKGYILFNSIIHTLGLKAKKSVLKHSNFVQELDIEPNFIYSFFESLNFISNEIIRDSQSQITQ